MSPPVPVELGAGVGDLDGFDHAPAEPSCLDVEWRHSLLRKSGNYSCFVGGLLDVLQQDKPQ